MSEKVHPWSSNTARDEAIRAAEDDAANWRRLDVGEVVQEGDEYLNPIGGWYAVLTPHVGRRVTVEKGNYRRRRVPPPDHRDLPSAVAELLQNERDEALKQRDAALARVRDLSEMHSEQRRWNFQRTHDGIRVCFGNHDRAAACEWEDFVPADKEAPGLRSLVENLRDKLRSCESALKEAESERTEAIRDFRDAVKNADRHRAERDAVLRERYAARADVAALQRERDDALLVLPACCGRLSDAAETVVRERDHARSRVAELENAAKLASGVNAGGGSNNPAAPDSSPEPRGWLTAEEREAVRYFSRHCDENVVPEEWNEMALALRALLARETPPRVELPPVFTRGMFGDPLVKLELVKEALAAAGVKVKAIREAGVEVGE